MACASVRSGGNVPSWWQRRQTRQSFSRKACGMASPAEGETSGLTCVGKGRWRIEAKERKGSKKDPWCRSMVSAKC